MQVFYELQIAGLIDVFSYLYHWNLNDILNLSMKEIMLLLKVIERRVSQQNDEIKKSNRSNKNFGKKEVDNKDGDSMMKFFHNINNKVVVES